jgi:transcriptional regulator of arginine metabolism
MTIDRARRIRRIGELVEGGGVQSQEQLRALLLDEGIDATQATISRDLRELGVVKGPTGYAMPAEGGVVTMAPDRDAELEQELAMHLHNARPAASIAVLHTAPGHAQPLGVALDNARPDGVVGVLAGDDTIFLACTSESAASSVVRRLRRSAGLD